MLTWGWTEQCWCTTKYTNQMKYDHNTYFWNNSRWIPWRHHSSKSMITVHLRVNTTMLMHSYNANHVVGCCPHSVYHRYDPAQQSKSISINSYLSTFLDTYTSLQNLCGYNLWFVISSNPPKSQHKCSNYFEFLKNFKKTFDLDTFKYKILVIRRQPFRSGKRNTQ